jgi:adenylate cyclase
MADEGFKRKLTAILSADVEGYSRLMGDDEEATVRTITAYREVLSTLIQQHNGKVLDSPGDNLLAEFVSVVDAVQCAVAVQKEIKARNDELPENRRMQFRIGINLGDVIQEEERIYGDGVNIAARLEGLAEPGGICVSKTAFDHIESKLPYGYDFIGNQTVKNIAKPVGAYRVLMDPRVTVSGKPEKEKRSPMKRRPIIIGIAAVLVLAIALGIWQFYMRRPSIEPASVEKMAYQLPDKPSIVVLPFDNLSKDPDEEYLIDGITDQIIMGLSKIPYMFVIAKESSFSYKGKAVEVRRVSEELGVQYVLEGSVQRSGDRIRISTQLIDAITGHHLWSERYDRELKDIFELQDDIMVNIMQAMQLKVAGLAILEDKPPPPSIEAHLKILKAIKHVYHWTKEDNALGRKLYEEAIELNPEYASTYRLLGWTYHHDVGYGWSESPGESLQKAEELANKALSLGDDEVYDLLTTIYISKGQNDKAIAIGEKGLAINSNSATYNAVFANVLRSVDRYEEALVLIKKAMRLNPNYPSWYLFILGRIYLSAERYNEVIPVYKKYIELSPSDFWGYLHLIACYIHLNREKEAREAVAEVLRINPKLSLEFVAKLIPPDRNQVQREKRETYLEALRKAGLPE